MNGKNEMNESGEYMLYPNHQLNRVNQSQLMRFGEEKPMVSKPNQSRSLIALPHKKRKKKEGESAHKDVEELEKAVEQAQNVLIQAKAVFPFDLFPDVITIDRQKLTVVHKQFFGVKQTVSVALGDLTNIQAQIGPLFGSLTVTSEQFINNTQTVNFLWKDDVLAIQQLVQGFIVVKKDNINIEDIDDMTLMKLLNELGQGEESERHVLR